MLRIVLLSILATNATILLSKIITSILAFVIGALDNCIEKAKEKRKNIRLLMLRITYYVIGGIFMVTCYISGYNNLPDN